MFHIPTVIFLLTVIAGYAQPYEKSDTLTWNHLNQLGVEAYESGNYKGAITWFEKATDQAEMEFGKTNSSYATSLSNLALSFKELGEYKKAEIFFIEGKSIREGILGKNHPDYANSLNNLAILYYAMGQYAKSESLFIEAKTIREETLGINHPDYANVVDNLGMLYELTGRFAKAKMFFKESKNIREVTLGIDHPRYAISLNNLGYLYEMQGLYTKAESLYIEAGNIFKNSLGRNHPFYATSLTYLAGLYKDQGLYSNAKARYFEAMSIIEKTFGKGHIDYATLLNNLALIYEKQLDFSRSLYYFNEAKKIQEKALGNNHPYLAQTIENLANLYSRHGDYIKAENYYKESIEIIKSSLGKTNLQYCNNLQNLASLYANKFDEYEKAENLLIEAKNIKAIMLGIKNPEFASSQVSLAYIYMNQNLHMDAELLLIEGIDIYLNLIKNNFSNLSSDEKGKFLNTFDHNFEIFQSLVLKRYQKSPKVLEKNFDLHLFTKRLLFNSSQKIKTNILSSGEEELVELYNNWKDQKSYLAYLYQMSIPKREADEIDFDEEESKANDLEKQLSAKSELFAQATDTSQYTWEDVRDQLNRGEAAIEMVRFNYYEKEWTDSVLYMAMIITTETTEHPELVILPNGNELEGKYLNAYQQSIYARYDSLALASRGALGQSTYSSLNTYNAYWKKINEKLEGINNVYLSLDGVYHNINLSALQIPETGKYIFDEVDIHRISSTRELVTPKKDMKSTNFSSLYGYPDYNNNTEVIDTTLSASSDWQLKKALSTTQDSTMRFYEGENIKLLPFTKVEIEHVQQTMKKVGIQTEVHLSKEATEQSIKELKDPKVLHIATHGFFLEDIEIDKDDHQMIMGIDQQKVFENPLHRSGLLFASAKQALKEGGDGVLTAYEAMNLNLDNTELVVMSACETGLGEVKNGEGVYGLQRAFQTAGARTVLMSLWSVSDAATQELMTLFYQNWLEKDQSKREAFRNAQLKLREKYPEPYYWASFVMVGE